jgi:hypothetical protein
MTDLKEHFAALIGGGQVLSALIRTGAIGRRNSVR